MRALISGTLLIVFVGCIFIAGCGDSESKKREPINLNQRSAPDFTAQTIDGEEIRLSDFKRHKAVIVDVWATWCPPCQREMPLLEQIYQKYGKKLEIIAVSVDKPTDIDKIRKFISDKKITFKIIHDTNGDISRKFPSQAIPFLTVINKDGQVVKTFIGYNASLETEIANALGL